MTKKQQTITNTIRKSWGIPAAVTDAELFAAAKGSLEWSRIEFGMAMSDLSRELKAALPKFVKCFYRVK